MKRVLLLEKKNKEIFVLSGKCYKVFDSSYDKAEILAEAYNHARVEETDLRIPKLLGFDRIDGNWAIITEFVDGKTLQQLMDENPDQIDSYLDLFIDLQLECQSKQCPRLPKHNDKMNYKICNTDLSATLRYDLHSRVEAMSKVNQLCHGDFNPTNIVITDEGVPYIIDWSHATIGNPEADTARSYMLFCIEGKKDIADKYLEKYCSRTNEKPESIKAWLPILAATQSLKNRENEREILQKFIYEKYED